MTKASVLKKCQGVGRRALPILNLICPYAIIFALSIISCYLLFYDGFPLGDDFYFHMGNIADKYLSLTGDAPFSAISGNVALGYGYGATLFYSPLTHLSVAIVWIVMEPFGFGLFGALKLTFFITVFLSGIFMYRFALRLCRNNRLCALLGAGMYILYPYRIFDFLCRNAIAEAFAFLFIPLFFMGLYDIVHMDKKEISALPFAYVALGGALLYLTHNLTSLLVFIVGIFYLVFSIKKLFPLLKKVRFLIYGALAVILLIFIASVGLFSQMELLSTDYYNLSDEELMWTSPSHLSNRTGEQGVFSGFLNMPWLVGNGMEAEELLGGFFLFLFICFIFVLLDRVLSISPVLKYLHLPISTLFASSIVLISDQRAEIGLGFAVFAILYWFFTLSYKKEKDNFQPSLKSSPLLILSVLTIVVSFILMIDKSFWLYVAPEFLRKIQFPWRAWALVQMFASVLVCLLAHRSRSKSVTALIIALCSLMLVLSQPLVEKRMAYENQGYWYYEDIEVGNAMGNVGIIGHCKEYCPKELTDSEYNSKYYNSLQPSIRYSLYYNFYGKESYFIKPAILEGKGAVTVESAFAPVYELSAQTDTDKMLVQLPLIFYPGYEITAVERGTGKETKLTPTGVDGLVSFYVPRGEYEIRTEYEGTTLYNLSLVLTPVSLAGLISLCVYDIIYRKKKNKKG